MYEIILTRHAYEQYCRRVEPIDWDELQARLNAEVTINHPPINMIHAVGTWWATTTRDSEIMLTTCYGNGHMDMPAALTWAARHKDRLRLDDADEA